MLLFLISLAAKPSNGRGVLGPAQPEEELDLKKKSKSEYFLHFLFIITHPQFLRSCFLMTEPAPCVYTTLFVNISTFELNIYV